MGNLIGNPTNQTGKTGDMARSSPSGLRIGDCDELVQGAQSEWITKVVAFIIICLFCVVSNSLVIFLVYKSKKLHKDMCYLIVNMAVSDMLVMALGLREWMNILLSNSRSWKVEGTLGTLSCKICTLLRFVAPIVSLTTLIAISVERLRAVVSPTRVQPAGRLLFCLLLGLAWLIPIILYSYVLYAFDLSLYKDGMYCYDQHLNKNGWILYYLVFYVLVVVMFLTLVVLNVTIMKKLYKTQRAIQLPDSQKKKRALKFVRAVRMITCCSVLFVVCWGPRSCLRFLDHLNVLDFDYCVTKNWFFCIDFLFYLNFSSSPLVYFAFLKDFRDVLKETVLTLVKK